MTDDAELLRRYVRERSESAFTALVQRQAGLVYSAALRQVGGNAALAEEVSQAVFIDLARKAAELADRPVLASWLYTSTRFAALKARRTQQRQQVREQEAATMHVLEQNNLTDADWEKVQPLLDEELCRMSEPDRAAILLRYFEGQPFAVIGTKLGLTENSARMRAERALDKLRLSLAGKGITSTAVALGLVLSTQAVAAPPTGLATALAGSALAHSAVAGSSAGIAVKLSQLFAMNKIQAGLVALITVGSAGIASYEAADEKARATAAVVYAICFGVGLLFAVLSVAFGHLGHAHFATHHEGAGGHAEAGFGNHDMPGFQAVGPTTIATFITAFGGLGMILVRNDALHRFSGFISVVGALGITALVAWGFNFVFRWSQGSSEGRVAELRGFTATVITPIGPDRVGEIAYVQAGSRYSAPARAEHGAAFPNGATVRITRIVGAQFYVAAP